MPGILGIADLANNIASATKGLATAFGLANPEPAFHVFPDQDITAEFQREHWYKNPSQGLYSFSVEPNGQSSISQFPFGLDNIESAFTTFFNKDDSFGEFKLPITPQEITQSEDFAVTVKPTQGGTVLNHSGNRYKTLSISGTTGVQPYRGLLGVIKGNGVAIGKPDELKYRSGYEVFIHFRQWMRSYIETKSRAGSEDLRMVFRNYKDWEFLYVQPIKFTMKRDANKPLLYNYSIQLKVIGTLTINKPIFDFVVGKLNEVSGELVNSYALIKKNKSVTDSVVGSISDFEDSINNLKYAIKSANKEDIKLSEFSKSDAEKLSFRETLSVLNVIGNAMALASQDYKGAEQSKSTTTNADPDKESASILDKVKNPNGVSQATLKAKLKALVDAEPALLSKVGLDILPNHVRSILAEKQVNNALISRVEVKKIQTKAKELLDKLTESMGLGNATYNRIFGITQTIQLENQSEITDDKFEMLYALSRTLRALDGILSSDSMFDINAAGFKRSNSANGADNLGVGVFSFPNTNTGIKEGFLSAGVTLEDIALSELGDASRWTEIAELNNLKAPYIIDAADTLGVNYEVQSVNFTNPTQLRDLQITYVYLIPGSPTPGGAWLGKGNYLAEYLGGDKTQAASWRFIFPDGGTLIQVISTLQYFKYVGGVWTEIDPTIYTIDGVLKPGDKIKIPSRTKAPTITKVQGPRDNPYTNNLSTSEKSLGVDLKITEGFDLDLTPSGDLNIALGVDNAAQAIILKLLYEKGSLKKFPGIGTNLSPGKKMPDIGTLRADITSSLLQDPRIKNVSKINIIQENSAVSLSFEVTFNDIQTPVPVNIPI